MPVTVVPNPANKQPTYRGKPRLYKTTGYPVKSTQLQVRWELVKPETIVAIDIEGITLVGEVGTYAKGIGRVSVCDEYKRTILDTMCCYPTSVPVAQGWVEVSGVYLDDIDPANYARPIKEVINELQKILSTVSIVVCHNITAEQQYARGLSWADFDMRDTQKYSGYAKHAKNQQDPVPKPSLKVLAEKELSKKIQESKHSSVIDARTTMDLYLRKRVEMDAQQSKPTFQSSLLWEPAVKHLTDPTASCIPGWAIAPAVQHSPPALDSDTPEQEDSTSSTNSSTSNHSRQSSTNATEFSTISASNQPCENLAKGLVASSYEAGVRAFSARLAAIGRATAVALPLILPGSQSHAVEP